MPLTPRTSTRQPQWSLTILCIFFIWQFLVTLYTLWFNLALLFDYTFNWPRSPGRDPGAFMYVLHYLFSASVTKCLLFRRCWCVNSMCELCSNFSIWLIMNLSVLVSIVSEVAKCGNQRLSLRLYLNLQIAKTIYVCVIFTTYVTGNFLPARPWTPSFWQWVSSTEGFLMTVVFVWVYTFLYHITELICETGGHLRGL
jgi:hypothetical protein